MNPRAQIVFEDESGEPIETTEEDLPFDLKAPVIEIDEIDYGIWYLDAMEHPEHYKNKKLKFLAQVYRGRKLGSGLFVPGRSVRRISHSLVIFAGIRKNFHTRTGTGCS